MIRITARRPMGGDSVRSRLFNRWSHAMRPLLFTCPKTKQQAPAGIETDFETLRAAWSETLKVSCPLCGGVHNISVRETYIYGALNDALDRHPVPLG